MTTSALLLATLLNVSPGIQLTDNVEGRAATLDEMTRAHVSSELRRLDNTRPALGGTVTLLAFGAPAFVLGAISTGFGISYLGASFGVAASTSMFAGIVPYFLIGAVLAFGVIPGAILLIAGIRAAMLRNNNIAQTRELAAKLDEMDEARQPAAAAAPAQGNYVVPAGMQILTTF